MQSERKIQPLYLPLEPEDRRRAERLLRQAREATGRIHLASSRTGRRAVSRGERPAADALPRPGSRAGAGGIHLASSRTVRRAVSRGERPAADALPRPGSRAGAGGIHHRTAGCGTSARGRRRDAHSIARAEDDAQYGQRLERTHRGKTGTYMKRRLYQLDVFTTRPFAGNPPAVSPDGDGLSVARMQAIAREMNLSETVFVQRPTNNRALARLRIFTTTAELPLAGHPVIGTWFLMGELGVVPAQEGSV